MVLLTSKVHTSRRHGEWDDVVDRRPAVEHEAGTSTWLNRQVKVDHRRHLAGPTASGIDGEPAAHSCPRFEADSGHPATVEINLDDPILDIGHVVVECPLAHPLKESPAVKAALAQPTDASADELIDVHVRISIGNLPGPQHLDFGTHRQLLDRLFFESPVCRLVLGDEHIAGTTEVDLGRLPVDLHTFVEVGNELGTEPAQLNVERIGVLLPDAVLRPRRVRIVVGPVGLDDEHRPIEVGVL